MDLIAALIAVFTAYIAYFNFVLSKRLRAREVTPLSRHLLVQSLFAVGVFSLSTCLFAISAAVSSTAIFTGAIFALALVGISSLVFRVVRPKQ